MSALDQDPAVLTWMICLSPRERLAPLGRHWWRDVVSEAWRSATEAWERDREATALGYATEEREYAQAHPRPRLRDFMVHMSNGTISPERLQS